ncbi:hypothetical protein I3842_06G096000 [Carya illinoinensis]|uniref:Secreted protein n=1 Tax=Carya illinoinensis TaxID=32201 RepID=A0A922JKN6_CARIL|nr:hypothetical protein I3842_06G096000 [Carya illinoinensis]
MKKCTSREIVLHIMLVMCDCRVVHSITWDARYVCFAPVCRHAINKRTFSCFFYLGLGQLIRKVERNLGFLCVYLIN